MNGSQQSAVSSQQNMRESDHRLIESSVHRSMSELFDGSMVRGRDGSILPFIVHRSSFIVFLLASGFWLLTSAALHAATHVTGTYDLGANPRIMTTVGGTPEYGLVFAQRNKAVTYNSVEYGPSVVKGYLNVSGQLNDGAGNLWLDLIPNADAIPSDSYYVVTINIQGRVHAEIWVVPNVASVAVEAVRQVQPPGATGSPFDLANATGLLALAHGGTNQSNWTAARCVRVNNAGTQLESAAADCGSGGGSAPIASATVSGTVKTDTTVGDPVVYLNTTADTLLAGKASSVHTHSQNDVTNLTTDLAGKESTANKNQASGYAGLTAATKLNAAQGQEVWSVADLSDYGATSGSGSTALKATIASPADAQCLVWSAGTSNWVNGSCAGGSSNHNLLSATHPDTAAAAPVLGDMLYANSTPAWAKLAGNTTSSKRFLTQTGTGSASAAPAWGTIAASDLPAAVVYNNQANTYTAGMKQTFQNSAATAGLNLASSADPSTPAPGDLWINSEALKWRGAATTYSATPQARSVSTSSPLSGGGALTADLTLSCPTCEVTTSKNAASGYAGLTASTKLNAAQGQEVWGVADLSDFTGKSGSGTTALGTTITSPADNQCITYDLGTTNWINETCPGGGGGDNVSVNGVAATNADFDDATPAAESGYQNVKWQKDALDPTNISAEIPFATASLAGTVSTAAQTFAGDKTNNGRFLLPTAPPASATQSSLSLGSAISGGDADGTYIGLNSALSYAGDYFHIQDNGSSFFRLSPSATYPMTLRKAANVFLVFDNTGANEFSGFRFQNNAVDRYTAAYNTSIAQVVFSRFNSSGTWLGDALTLTAGGMICNDPSGSNSDACIARSSAGVLEINNGTLGTLRDLKAQVVNAVTGFQVNGAAASGNVLRGNGTNFVSAQLACTDVSSCPSLISAGSNGIAAYNAGDDATAARSDHTHRSMHQVTWFFPGTPATGVQNMTLVLPEGVANPAITDLRVTVNTTSASSSTFNIQRCTASCTGTSPTFANIYSTNLTLGANTRTTTKAAAPDQNVSGLAAGDQFKANLVSIGASLADVTVAMTVKYENTN